MRTRRSQLVIVGVVVAALGLYLWTATRSDEPILHGHPLTYWAAVVESEESPAAIDAAFADMDGRCINFLIRELEWRPSSVVDKLNYISDRVIHTEPFHQPPDYRMVAAVALGRLGPRAICAVPALEKASHTTGGGGEEAGSARGAAIAALIRIRHESVDACAQKAVDYFGGNAAENLGAIYFLGTNAAPAVPFLVRALETATNEGAKCYAAHALSFVHSRPELAVPALTSMLTETNESFRFVGAMCLERFGPAARPAWDALVRCLNDPANNVAWAATNALCAIDLEAARQMGLR